MRCSVVLVPSYGCLDWTTKIAFSRPLKVQKTIGALSIVLLLLTQASEDGLGLGQDGRSERKAISELCV